jgi:hypothetical protein
VQFSTPLLYGDVFENRAVHSAAYVLHFLCYLACAQDCLSGIPGNKMMCKASDVQRPSMCRTPMNSSLC